MPRCGKIKENLTAWIDGELPVTWSERVELHLARCEACRREALALKASVESQRQWLPQMLAAAPVDVDRLLANVRRGIANADPVATEAWWRGWSWTQLLRPIPMAIAATAILLVYLVEVAGGPEDVLVPIGVKAPPPAVARKPGMFRDYAIIEKLDVLENFDTVEVEPLDEDQAGSG